MSKIEINKKIKECELTNNYSAHLFPIDKSLAIPVTKDFQYIKKGITWWRYKIEELVIVNPFTWYINKIRYKAKAYGRKNLKGLKGAVVTCNHVAIFDCLVARYSLRGNRLNITAAPFNNRKDFLGEMMRAGGVMPFGEDLSCYKNINKSIKILLEKKKQYVMFYPEQSMWLHYKKPRPYVDGAYVYAYKHNVPILPLFITFTDRKQLDEEGLPKQKFHMHILPPIYPKEELSKEENIIYMRELNEKIIKEKYEEFYNEKL